MSSTGQVCPHPGSRLATRGFVVPNHHGLQLRAGGLLHARNRATAGSTALLPHHRKETHHMNNDQINHLALLISYAEVARQYGWDPKFIDQEDTPVLLI